MGGIVTGRPGVVPPRPAAGGEVFAWRTLQIADALSVEDATGSILDTAPTQDGSDRLLFTVTKDGVGRTAADAAAWARFALPGDAFTDADPAVGTKGVVIAIDRLIHPHTQLAFWAGLLTQDGLAPVGGIVAGIHAVNAAQWRPWAGNGSSGGEQGASNAVQPDGLIANWLVAPQPDGDLQVATMNMIMHTDGQALRVGGSSGTDDRDVVLAVGVSWKGNDTPSGLVIGGRVRWAPLTVATGWPP